MCLPARRYTVGSTRGIATTAERGSPATSSSGSATPPDDPARHRDFEIRATYDQAANGWVAQVAEQNRNEQPGAWAAEVLMDGIRSHVFPTAATCLGDAVTSVVTLVDREA